jgi:hypothetical protein
LKAEVGLYLIYPRIMMHGTINIKYLFS